MAWSTANSGAEKINDKESIDSAFFMLEELACGDDERCYDPRLTRDGVWEASHEDADYLLVHYGVWEAYQGYGFLTSEIYDLLRRNKIDIPGVGLQATDRPEAPEREEANLPTHPGQADTPPLIPSPRIAAAFAGMGSRDEERWKSVLADPPDWLEAACRKKGRKGPGNAAMWDPVVIALHLMERGAPRPKLDAIFNFGPFQEWQPHWQEHAE
ncbi:hypothetical protein ACU4HD_14190 [Cupriavidus basilensis]